MNDTLPSVVLPISARAVQENFIAYFRIFAGLPEITFVENDEMAWIVTRQGGPGTQVLAARFAADTAGEAIDATLHAIGQLTDAVDWMVWPDDEPDKLGEHLKQRGAAGGPDGGWMLYGNQGDEPGTWMVIDLRTLPDTPVWPDGFRVERVQDERQFAVWVEVNARGFDSSSREEYSNYENAYRRHGFGEDAQAIHFIGYQGDTPVTSSTLQVAGGSASAYNISTPVEMRCRGYGGAITQATLLEARRRGFDHSWIWSSPMGRSVYQRIGFVITDFGVREYQWKKK